MKKVLSKVLSMALAFMLVFSSMVSPAVAANLPEVEEYLDTTYANAIDPYGSLQKDDAGRYVMACASKTSVSLKKDASSKEYAASWSSSDEAYAQNHQ